MPTLRVYRLDITMPPEGDPNSDSYDPWWKPTNWDEIVEAQWLENAPQVLAPGADPSDPLAPTVPDWTRFEAAPWPGWPAARNYLSRSAADRRANLFREYGATVTVVASDPVTWPAEVTA